MSIEASFRIFIATYAVYQTSDINFFFSGSETGSNIHRRYVSSIFFFLFFLTFTFIYIHLTVSLNNLVFREKFSEKKIRIRKQKVPLQIRMAIFSEN